MVSIDSAIYRMKAYSALLLDSVEHAQKDVGQDIRTLLQWIDYARPRLGAITPSAEAANPFARHGITHGITHNQAQAMTEAEGRLVDLLGTARYVAQAPEPDPQPVPPNPPVPAEPVPTPPTPPAQAPEPVKEAPPAA